MSRVFDVAKQILPKLMTWGVVILAGVAVYLLYGRWSLEPWTRDGQVRADVVRVTPQVNGNLVNVAVTDNQFVRKGQLLFAIDPQTYQLAVDKARVGLTQARDEVASLEASVRVAEARYDEAKVSVTSAQRSISAAEASVESARASVKQAKAGVVAAEQLIKQRRAELDNAKSEAARAERLVEKKAGSVEDAESTLATSLAREAQLASAEAGLTQANASLTQSEAGLNEANVNLLLAQDGLAQAQAAESSALATLEQAKATLGAPGDANSRIQSARVSLSQAELDLQRTRIVSPCNGYVSNLSVDVGSYAVVGQPLVALVNADTYRVHAYFQETRLRNIRPNDRATVTLMSHPDRALAGVVESVGNAVNPPNVAPTEGQAGEVPQIAPTFDWVRLPQRVPVRVRLSNIPEDVRLISGTTASVSVRPGVTE